MTARRPASLLGAARCRAVVRVGLRTLLLLALAFGLVGAARACTGTACVTMGPRLASVDSTQGALLNALLGRLTGTTLTLGVADWSALAAGDLALGPTVGALQTTLGVSSPTTALATSATLAQILNAAAVAAAGDNQATLAAALNGLKLPLQTLGGSVRLGDLLTSDGRFGTTRINALNLVTGVVQLYNARNVVTTPAPLTLSAADLGLAGIASSVTLSAQVVEAPVWVCGPVGSTFHTATVRLKLGIELLTLNLPTSALAAVPLVSSVSARLSHLDLYVEVARADGAITLVDAVANAFRVQVAPGVADLYLGDIADGVFFDRARVLNAATDLGWGTIGAVTVNGLTVAIQAKASARGGSAGATTVAFSGVYPQAATVSAGAGFSAGLVASLAGNLQIRLTAGLGVLEAPIAAVLQPVVQLALPSVLQTLLDGLVDPLLRTLGVGLGQARIEAGGTVLSCSISGTVYEDANHSGRLEAGEAGTGVALYAKLVPAAAPGTTALAVASVHPVTGAFVFDGIAAGASYQVVVNTSASPTQLTPAAPAGWLATEAPTLRLAATLATTDLAGLRAGLWHGSRLDGRVFVDDGAGGGIAHDGLRNGGEAATPGVALRATDAAGTVVHDRTTSGDAGAYRLWIPFAAGGAEVRVVRDLPADRVAISGSVGDTGGSLVVGIVRFTNVAGTGYAGVDFGDVAANRFEPDGRQQVAPGGVAFFPHAFVAGSAGQVVFTPAASGPAAAVATVYPDASCSGQLAGTEAPLGAAALAAVPGQRLCVVVKVAVPLEAPNAAQIAVSVTARWTYQRIATTSDHLRADLVLVDATGAGPLQLSKTVDKASAAAGERLTYTVVYANVGSGPLNAVKIVDATPAYTVFVSATCGTASDPSLACSVSAAPAVGAAGRIEWTLGGALPSGASGRLTLSVQIQ